MFVRRLALPAALLVCVWISACASCRPAQDPDGQLWGATSLPLEEWRSDQIWCKQPKPNDCQDWRWLQPEGEGEITIEIQADSGAAGVEVSLTDEDAERLVTEAVGRDGRARIVFKPRRARYYVLVIMGSADARKQYSYQIRASQVRHVEPPQPRYRAVEAMLLEVERRAGGEQTVLIGLGEQRGVQVGLRGRLVEGGKTIAEIEIIEVFPDGSRARLDGAPASRITPETTVEIDVPVGGAGPP